MSEPKPPPPERSGCTYHGKPFRYTATVAGHHYYKAQCGCDYELRYSIDPPNPTPNDEHPESHHIPGCHS